MQIAGNTPAKTPPFIPLIKGVGEYAAELRDYEPVFVNEKYLFRNGIILSIALFLGVFPSPPRSFGVLDKRRVAPL